MRSLIILFLSVIAATSCASRPSSGPHPWTHLNFDNKPDEFQFAIVADRTGRHRPGVFEKGLDKLNLLRPEFVMCVGDLIEGYTKDEAEIDQQWDEIESFTSKLHAPFFYVPGNHDLSNAVQARKWRERFGDAYYHFVYRGVLFLCVNTYDPESRISPEQIASFGKALKENPDARWTCVFMHEPLWTYDKPTGWDAVEKLLADRAYTVFAGHSHMYTKYVRHDRRYIVLATTGGGRKSELTGTELGSFDHVTWVTMLPDGPRLANIEIDAIHDEDIRTEAAANLIDRVLRGEVLEISPVFAPEGQFDHAAATLKFTNDSDVAMSAKGSLPAGMLHAKPDRFDVTVPPKSSTNVTIDLRAERPAAVAELTPMAVKWSAIYAMPGRAPLTVPRTDLLAVERVTVCPERTAPVQIDGKLDDWAAMPLGGETYRFAVEHDERNVYLAVKVKDDRLVLSQLKEPWSQDGVEIRLDARSEPQRSQGRGRGEFKDILVVSMSPGEAPEKFVLYNREALPKDVRVACVKTADGFAAEVAIPAGYLDGKQGGAWKQFRLNVTVDDYDDVAGPLKATWWRPDWRSPRTFSGSGTFERK